MGNRTLTAMSPSKAAVEAAEEILDALENPTPDMSTERETESRRLIRNLAVGDQVTLANGQCHTITRLNAMGEFEGNHSYFRWEEDGEIAHAAMDEGCEIVRHVSADEPAPAPTLPPSQPAPAAGESQTVAISLLEVHNFGVGKGLFVRAHEHNAVVSQLKADLAAARADNQKLKVEIADLQKHELLASGYHKRTEREVEISAVLDEIPEGDRDSADCTIAELLDLVDAGRNRVLVAEDKAAALRGALGPLIKVAEEAVNRLHDLGESEYPAGNITEILDAVAALTGSAGSAGAGCDFNHSAFVENLVAFDLILYRRGFSAESTERQAVLSVNNLAVAISEEVPRYFRGDECLWRYPNATDRGEHWDSQEKKWVFSTTRLKWGLERVASGQLIECDAEGRPLPPPPAEPAGKEGA